MKITLKMFQGICSSSHVTPRITDIVRGMRYKSSATDEHLMTCHSSVRSPPPQQAGSLPAEILLGATYSDFEVCYNLRHFERHGRDLQDPWSCRQSAIHQRHYFSDETSAWIVIQPPALWESSLDDARLDQIGHPLVLHLRALSLAVANNTEYLEYISSEISSLEHRVTFPKHLVEYDFDFTLSQAVQQLRRRLHRVTAILEGTQRVVSTLSCLAEAIKGPGNVTPATQRGFLRELDNISRTLNSHHATTVELLNASAGIRTTIHSILDFRNQDALNNNEIQLQRIMQYSAKESDGVNKIVKLTYKDSRAMRVAAVIGLFYLPANLVLTLFSTSFIEILDPASNATAGTPSINNAASAASGEEGRLVVHRQIWLFFPCTIALIVVTWLWFFFWARRPCKGSSSC